MRRFSLKFMLDLFVWKAAADFHRVAVNAGDPFDSQRIEQISLWKGGGALLAFGPFGLQASWRL
jgi:hypothetical protein